MLSDAQIRAIRICFLVCLFSSGVEGATLSDFAPQGEVRPRADAVATFSNDMVKLGETEGVAPFDVSCPAEGKARWVSPKVWKYKLNRNLKAGEQCHFYLKPNLKTLSGEVVSAENLQGLKVADISFFVGGPAITNIEPSEESNIEEDQHFIVTTNAPINSKSVEAHAWCEIEGVGERIPVAAMSSGDLDKLLFTLRKEHATPNQLGLYCKRALTPGAKMKLVWGKGIESFAAKGAGTGKTTDAEEKAYKVRAPFRAELTCEREKTTAPCSALSDIKLQFSDQVSLALAEKIQLVSKTEKWSPAQTSPAHKLLLIAKNPRLFYLKNVVVDKDHLDTIVFKGPFTPNTTFSLQLPADFKDLSGRALSNIKSFPLKTQVGILPPLAKFSAEFGILERNEGGILPVTLRNVESKMGMQVLKINNAEDMINRMNALYEFEQQKKEITPNKPKLKQRKLSEEYGEEGAKDGGSGEAYEEEQTQEKYDYQYARELSFLANDAKSSPKMVLPRPKTTQPFEVVGIPLQKSGFYVVEIESKLLGNALLSEAKPIYVRSTALVTNLGVHLKKGEENSLLWVTNLATGKPVSGAEVALYDCHANSFWQGKTDAHGRAVYADRMPDISNCSGRYVYYATAKLGDDFSFVRSDWHNGIEPWRFNVDTYGSVESPKIHTILDRTMLRAGETVSMKHIARIPKMQGYDYPKEGTLPVKMTIELVGGDFSFDTDLTWDARGVATSSWQIPQDAPLGNYAIKIGDQWRNNAEFRVSEFRLPAFKGAVAATKNRYANVQNVPVNLSLAYLNGGGASGQQVQISSELSPTYLHFADYDDFGFSLDEENNQTKNQLLVDKQTVTLDKNGLAKYTVPLKNKVKAPSSLHTEMTFTDPNGEIQTISGQTELWPANLALGLQVKDWAGLKGKHKVQAVVLNMQGKPQAGIKVSIHGTRSWQYTHRKRIIGGFYSYETDNNSADLGELCTGTSNAQGFVNCEVEVKEAGNIKLLASVKDAQGNVVQASSGFWASDLGDIWFGQGDEDRMEVIPEQRSYEAGETARLQVHTPFYQSTALIAVEREGILQTFVQPLTRGNALVEIPIKDNWGPNVFVSVLAVRGRLVDVPWYSFFQWGWHSPKAWWKARQEGVPEPTAMVDLARPSYKFGLTRINIGSKGVALHVKVASDKQAYKPRDKAKITVNVTLPNGKPAPAGSEVTLLAVDKALLELAPNHSWDLLESMQQQHPYQIETSSAQMQVIGKRHFGKKALPAGGDGGAKLSARELFNTLLYWNARVKLDKNGAATVQVPLNDSLTAFKIVAIADVDANFYGKGDTEIVSRQDLQMTSGLPPMMREGDFYRAMLMLRNTTEATMQLRVNAKAGAQDLASQSINLAAGEAKELNWEVKAPENAIGANLGQIPWAIEALDANGKLQDSLKFTQKILPRTPITVQQASFMQLENPYKVATQLPPGAIAGKGGIDVRLTAKLADQVSGIERYFNEYPYSCLEQQISIATGLHSQAHWQSIVANISSYQNADGFLSYFPGMSYGSDLLTAYVMMMTYENKVKLPVEVEAKMQQALLDFVAGRSEPQGWYWGNKHYLKERRLTALAALSYAGKVDASMLDAFELKPIQLATASLIDWEPILQHLPNQQVRKELVERELRNRLQNVAGRLQFNTEQDDVWWWAMLDGEVNTTRLTAILMNNPVWQKDMTGLLRGLLLRQNKGRWGTTLANAWGRLALDKFGQKFERDVVTGITTAKLGDIEKKYEWTAQPSTNQSTWRATRPLLPLCCLGRR